jgi:molybdate transport system substrate-binding protein
MSEDRISVYAAGSLRVVLPALVAQVSARTGIAVTVRHGPAGLLRELIEAGDRPDLFLSANLAHPARLAAAGLAAPAVIFARNTLAAVVRRDAGITTANFVERLLAPDVAIATSTPGADPSGDYAFAVFKRIDALRPGAGAVLEAKAQKLVGATLPSGPPGNYDAVSVALRDGTATLFLGYATGLKSLAAEMPELEIVAIPPEVNVTPDYALAVPNGGTAAGKDFALFILSAAGQELLREAGFVPVR